MRPSAVFCAAQWYQLEQCLDLNEQPTAQKEHFLVYDANLLDGTIAADLAPDLADAPAGLRRQLCQLLRTYLQVQ